MTIHRQKTPYLSASVLGADARFLDRDIKRACQAGIRYFHVDVMDGHFVNNISMGPAWAAAVHKSLRSYEQEHEIQEPAYIDVHLMIYNPHGYVEQFIAAGADRITFHIEATEDVPSCIDFIRSCGKDVGIALNPATPLGMLDPYLECVDAILVMSVVPGFGGQRFLDATLPRLEELNHRLEMMEASQSNSNRPFQRPILSVDGGINATNALACASKGACELVSGSFLFSHSDMLELSRSLEAQLSKVASGKCFS